MCCDLERLRRGVTTCGTSCKGQAHGIAVKDVCVWGGRGQVLG